MTESFGILFKCSRVQKVFQSILWMAIGKQKSILSLSLFSKRYTMLGLEGFKKIVLAKQNGMCKWIKIHLLHDIQF